MPVVLSGALGTKCLTTALLASLPAIPAWCKAGPNMNLTSEKTFSFVKHLSLPSPNWKSVNPVNAISS